MTGTADSTAHAAEPAASTATGALHEGNDAPAGARRTQRRAAAAAAIAIREGTGGAWRERPASVASDSVGPAAEPEADIAGTAGRADRAAAAQGGRVAAPTQAAASSSGESAVDVEAGAASQPEDEHVDAAGFARRITRGMQRSAEDALLGRNDGHGPATTPDRATRRLRSSDERRRKRRRDGDWPSTARKSSVHRSGGHRARYALRDRAGTLRRMQGDLPPVDPSLDPDWVTAVTLAASSPTPSRSHRARPRLQRAAKGGEGKWRRHEQPSPASQRRRRSGRGRSPRSVSSDSSSTSYASSSAAGAGDDSSDSSDSSYDVSGRGAARPPRARRAGGLVMAPPCATADSLTGLSPPAPLPAMRGPSTISHSASAFAPVAAARSESDRWGGGSAGRGGDARAREAARADANPVEVDPGVTWESVGGLEGNVQALKEMVLLPLLYPEVFQQFNVRPPRGVLFYGPPGACRAASARAAASWRHSPLRLRAGTGKTLCARALANSCSVGGQKVSFFMRKGADCLSKARRALLAARCSLLVAPRGPCVRRADLRRAPCSGWGRRSGSCACCSSMHGSASHPLFSSTSWTGWRLCAAASRTRSTPPSWPRCWR